MEKFISTRITKDKETSIVETGKGIFASFVHDTSRNLDPQLHMHVINMNITEHEGQLKSLSSDYINKQGYMELIYKHHTLFGTMQRDILESKVKDLGYEIEHKEKGLWEIKGVPQDILDNFSSRSQEVREAVGDGASFESRNVAALDTRSAKTAPDKEVLLEEWNSAIKEHGFDIDTFIDKAVEKQISEVSSAATSLAQGEDNKNIADADKELLDDALSSLTNKKRDFSYNDVLMEILTLSEEKTDFEKAEKIIEHAIEVGGLIPLESDKTRFTSANHLLDEQSVKILSEQHLNNAPVIRDLTGKTEKSLNFTNTDSISIVKGESTFTGVRKITDNLQVKFSEKGNDVYLLTPTAARKNQVFTQSKIDADQQLTFSDLANSNVSFKEDSAVIVDNAERLSAKDAVNLLSHANESNLQIVLVNTSSRESNTNILNLFKDAGVKEYDISSVSDTTKINVISEKDKHTRLKNVSDEYIQSILNSEEATVVAANQKDKEKLTNFIREDLLDAGLIQEEKGKVTVQSRTDLFLTSQDKAKISSYAPGLIIEDRGSVKRETFSIISVNENTRTITLKDGNGESKEVKPKDLNSKDIRVFKSKDMDLAVGDKIKHTAAIREQDIKSKDLVTITSIDDGVITGVNSRTGDNVTLFSKDPLYGEYGYVSSVGEVNKENGKVIVPLSKRDLNANNINSLRMSGNEISIHSPLDDNESLKKISNLNIKTTISDVVIKKAGESDISIASDILKKGVEQPESIAVNRAIDGMRSIGITKLDLIEKSMLFDSSAAPLIELEVDKRISDGRLIKVSDSENSILVPKEIYEIEKDIVSIFNSGAGTKQPLLLNVQEEKFNKLTPGQKDAVKEVLTTSDTFTLIQGYAGVGKTTKLRSLKSALEDSFGDKIEIRGLGPTHRAVGEMQDVGIEAQTLKSYNINAEKDTLNGTKVDYSNTLFVIDESSMVGNSDMRDTVNHISKNGGRAVIMGDRAQFLAIENGSPFSLTQERTNSKVVVMNDVVRQTNPLLKEAVYDSIDGKTRSSLEKINAIETSTVPRREGINFPEKSISNDFESLSNDFLSRTDEARNNTLIITGTNEFRRNINRNIQEGLLQEKTLNSEESISFNIFTQKAMSRTDLNNPEKWKDVEQVLMDEKYYRVDKTEKDMVTLVSLDTGKKEQWSYKGLDSEKVEAFKTERTSFYSGDKVVIRKTDIDSGKQANTPYTITSISENGLITLEGNDGVRIIDPKNNVKDRHIDLGYAVTSTGAQGASSEYVIGYLGTEGAESRLSNKRAFYITISRAKEHVQLYTDATTDKLIHHIDKSRDEVQTAHDLLSPRTYLDKAKLVSSFSKDIDNYYAGRVLIDEFNLNKETSELSLLSRTKHSPLRLSLNNYDENGKFSGISTYSLETNKGNVVIGDLELVSEDFSFSIIQKGTQDNILSASNLKDGLELARDNPESSVIILKEGQEVTSHVLDVLNINNISNIEINSFNFDEVSAATKDDIEQIVIDSVGNADSVNIELNQESNLNIDEPQLSISDDFSYQELYNQYVSEAEVYAEGGEMHEPTQIILDSGHEEIGVSDQSILLDEKTLVDESPGIDIVESVTINLDLEDKELPDISLPDVKSIDVPKTDLAEVEMLLVDRTSHHEVDLINLSDKEAITARELIHEDIEYNRTLDLDKEI